MNWEIFIQKMQEEIGRLLGPDAQVSVFPVTKNNGVILHTVSIREGESNVNPAIYLESFYRSYGHGKSIEELAGEVVSLYRKNRIREPMDLSCLMEFEKMRGQIVYRLVNYEKNHELLRDTPHVRFLDMALVFGCVLERDAFGSAFVLIKERHMRLWQVGKEELLGEAVQNTPSIYTPEIFPLEDAISGLLAEQAGGASKERGLDLAAPARWEEPVSKRASKLYVLTNQAKWYGAACILYPGLLGDIAEKLGDDILILPSSIHEVILLPAGTESDTDRLADMVREINDTEVEPEEILSYHVYRYFSAERTIRQVSYRMQAM